MSIRGAAVRYIALLALLPMAACAQATQTPVPTATPTPTVPPPRVAPAAERDIREQIVEAIQRPGFVTKVRISITPPEEEAHFGSQTETAWIDLPGRRIRVEIRSDTQLTSVSIVSGGTDTTYNRDINTVDEYSHSFTLPPEVAETLPPSLNNPALLGLGHLAMPLILGDWHPAGTGEWKQASASVWKADSPGGPEGSERTFATIYLNAETLVPMGLEMTFAQEGSTAEFTYLITYRFEFLAPDAVPEGVFDVQGLRELQHNYGGKLDEARSLDFTVLWLGKEFDLGEDYPKLELTNVSLGRGDPVGGFAAFYYRIPSDSSDDSQGRVDVRVWQRDLWESQIQKNAPPDVWWRDPELRREEIAVDGVTAEFAIGPLDPLLPPATVRPYSPERRMGQIFQIPSRYMELRLWLPDSVVFINASPIRPTQFPAIPPEKGAATPPVAVTPDLGSAYDLNVFNTEEGMRALLQALEVLR